MKFKKIFSFMLIVMLSIITFTANIEAKDNIWTTIASAKKYEDSGQLNKALPLWLNIISYFESKNKTKDDWSNSAVFHKKAAKYYDELKDYQNAVFHYEKENENWLKVGNNWGAWDLIRADKIRTNIDLYAKTTGKSYNLAKYEPANGIYYGIYSENDKAVMPDLSNISQVYGNHEIFLYYAHLFRSNPQADSEFPTQEAQAVKKLNGALQIALEPNEGLDFVKETPSVINWAKEAGKSGVPIFLRFAGEMNGDWVPWNGNPAKYREKFILVHNIMEKYAPNVAMVWSPNDVPIEDNNKNKIDDYYPGDAYVDWVGVNFYVDFYDSGKPTADNNLLQNPIDHLKYIYSKYSARKPIIICETGVGHYSIPDNKDLTDWGKANLEKLYNYLPIAYPRVKAITYFSLNQANPNYNVGNRWNNYALSENKIIKETYKSLVNLPNHIGLNKDSGLSYTRLNSPSEIKLAKEIYGVYKIPDYKISKVEYYVDDKLVQTTSAIPYILKYDLTKAKKLTIKIYNSNNELKGLREISF